MLASSRQMVSAAVLASLVGLVAARGAANAQPAAAPASPSTSTPEEPATPPPAAAEPARPDPAPAPAETGADLPAAASSEPAGTPPEPAAAPAIDPAMALPAPPEPVGTREGNISLEELLNVDMNVASLAGSTTVLTSPASVTTITEEDIRLTPARNLLDLIEVYVPGALWMVHSEGPHPGFRGIIVDRNYKFLLLLNGRLLNQKAHAGAVTELENWDLGDIAEIRVLRGPGSVTHGPGAISGVISITTKDARRMTRGSVRARSFFPYASQGLSIENAFSTDFLEAYVYASIVATGGVQMRTFQVASNHQAGFIDSAFPGPAAHYYRDFNGEPQVKAHLDLRLWNEWNLWARYTSSGATAGAGLGVVTTADRFQTGFTPDGMPVLGPPETFRQIGARQFVTALTNDHTFSENLRLETTVSYSSLDWRRRLAPPLTFLPTDPPEIRSALVDRNSVRYYRQRFAESEVQGRAVLYLKAGEIVDLAAGGTITYNHWGPGWGDDVRDFRMGDASNFISGTDSRAYGFPNYRGVDPNAVWIRTDGFGAKTFSGLGEAKLRFHPLLTVLLSGRVDKNDYSQALLTPRVALTSELTRNTALRLIWQRAQRMNTAEQLFLEKKVNGNLAAPEELTGYEAILTTLPTPNISLSLSGFYNQLGVIAFNQNNFTTSVAGDLELFGAEAELSLLGEGWRAGINHSLVKQRSWRLRQGVTQSGISYSDYAQPTREDAAIVIRGEGNDLNNWANHASKLFVNVRARPWLVLHLDSRVFWKFEGAQDGIDALAQAVAGSSRQQAMDGVLDRLEAEDVYGMDLRLNASASIVFSERFTFTLYGMNLAGIGRFKRYSYDAGNVQVAPVRTQYLEEPVAVGGTLEYGW